MNGQPLTLVEIDTDQYHLINSLTVILPEVQSQTSFWISIEGAYHPAYTSAERRRAQLSVSYSLSAVRVLAHAAQDFDVDLRAGAIQPFEAYLESPFPNETSSL